MIGRDDDGGATRPLFGDGGKPAAVAETQAPSDPLAPTAVGHAGPTDARTDAGVPATLSRFEIRSKLGEGGMGQVLLAVDPLLGREVALKVLHRDAGLGAEEARRRLMREAQGIARLSHENVIVVHEVGAHEGQVYVAMEYVRGGTLGQWQAGRSWSEVLDMYLRAGRGLVAAHEAGLVHRDFKPDNVLVGKDGRLRVTDFGLVSSIDTEHATRREVPDVDTLELGVSLTRTGTIMGTPRYMAPEQHLGEPVDARADQFAFCAALFEALYGRPPFAGADYRVLTANVLAGELEPVPSGSLVPPGIRDAVLRGLSRDRSDRFATVSELLAELTAARSRLTQPVESVPPTRARRRWLVPAIVAGLAGAGGVTALALRASGTASPVEHGGGESGSASSNARSGSASFVERAWAVGVRPEDQRDALEAFKAANAFLSQNRYEDARILYIKALRSWNHPAIHFNLALALTALGDRGRETLEHLDAALIYPAALSEDKARNGRNLRLLVLEQMADEKVAQTFNAGVAAYAKGDWAAAAKAFATVFEEHPDPAVLYNHAAALFRLAGTRDDPSGRPAVAAMFRRYRELSPKPDPAVAGAIASLEAPGREQIARFADLTLQGVLVVRSDPAAATVEIDNEVVGKTPWRGRLTGKRTIVIRSPGYVSETRHLTAVSPSWLPVTVVLDPI